MPSVPCTVPLSWKKRDNPQIRDDKINTKGGLTMSTELRVSLSVFSRQGKAYVPTVGDTGTLDMITGPVYTVNLSVEELTEVLEKVLRAGNPKIPQPTRYEMEHPRNHPLLKAAKVGSWKKLAQGGASYGISWRSNGVTLDMSRPNSKFEYDASKIRHFPPNVDMREIAQAILDDVHSRPELQSPS
jgi:hypothetical protein